MGAFWQYGVKLATEHRISFEDDENVRPRGCFDRRKQIVLEGLAVRGADRLSRVVAVFDAKYASGLLFPVEGLFREFMKDRRDLPTILKEAGTSRIAGSGGGQVVGVTWGQRKDAGFDLPLATAGSACFCQGCNDHLPDGRGTNPRAVSPILHSLE